MESSLKPEHFEFLRMLGKGREAEVWCARKRKGEDSGKLFAIKITEKVQKQNPLLTRELEALRQLSHEPFIVQCHGAIITDTQFNIVLDYAPGKDLYYVMKRAKLSVSHIRFYLAEIAVALDKVHTKNIVHQDIKPNNVLLDAKGHVLLADFGVCRYLDGQTNWPWEVGTRMFKAPEVLDSNVWKIRNREKARDCYALGVLALQMLFGLKHLPYGEQILYGPHKPTSEDLGKNLLGGMKAGVANIPDSVDKDLKDLLVQLLAVDCRDRLGQNGAFELKAHRFFKDLKWSDVEAKRLQPPYAPKLTPQN